MHYKYLSQIGENYQFEEGTPGVRHLALDAVADKLRQLMLDLKSALAAPAPAPGGPTVAPTGSNVAQMRAFHEQQQQATNPNVNVATIRARIDYYKTLLKREGATVDQGGNINWGTSHCVVQYDRDIARRNLTQLYYQGGRVFTDPGGHNPLDTFGMVTHFSGPGFAIYVMSEEGNIHVSSHSVGHRHHSSLLAGGNVAAAGELKASNGHITMITSKSGHYQPGMDHLLQILHQLQKRGIPMTMSVKVMGAGLPKTYDSVGALLKDLALQDDPDYELRKLMAYHQHLTPAVLGPNGWRWRGDATIEKAGVYVIATKQPVPHRDVRRWLKSQGRTAEINTQAGSGR